MPTPSPRQARSQHARQSAIAVSAGLAIADLFNRGAGWDQILSVLAQYQLAAATSALQAIAGWAGGGSTPLVSARSFAGVTSGGYPISEPLVATIDATFAAPVEALPAPWWDEASAFIDQITRVIEGQVKDAGRSAAQTEIVARPDWQNYVRLLTPPSCKRCVLLAGRVYRDLDGFSRHPPTCDCIHVPVQDWEEAHDRGLVSSPQEAFEQGMIRDLTVAETAAITDGADLSTVINSSSGLYTADVFGRRVKATTYGTTKRSVWRRQNPSRLIRLRPESIYRIAAGDRAEAIRLLRLYGFLTTT